MHFNADICTCENGSDKILSVCQCGPDGEIEHEVIIQRGPKEFDMLDDAALRPNQTLRYEGKIDVPVQGGEVKMDSYVQTGESIVPIHYLVDDQGQVQLITMGTVNWALTAK